MNVYITMSSTTNLIKDQFITQRRRIYIIRIVLRNKIDIAKLSNYQLHVIISNVNHKTI